jgi:hypothetical protein
MSDDPQDSTERPAAARRRPRRGRVLGLLGSAGLAAAGLAIVATTVSSAPSLPDLISEQTGPGRTQVYRDGRLLMRFDGFVSNAASAPAELEIWANNPNGQGVMTQVQQRVSGVAVPTGRSPVVRFEEADGHRHYHLKNAAEYTLWTADRSRQVALAQKTEAGFCLEDSLYNGGSGPAEYSANANDFCLQVDPGQTWRPGPLVMGVSPGYRDLYDAGLSYQWVDISNTPPGNYQLASRTDPTDVIAESNEGNNGYAFRAAVVPGFLPRQLSVGRVDPGQTANVALASDEFISECYDDSPSPSDTPYCNPGSVRYRIASLPTRGVIRQNGAALGVGSVLTSGAITYTANGGQRGGDQFTYEAFDISRPEFPVQKPQAAVAIQVGAPIVTVAISGAQASITAGVSMQLSAVLTNSTRGVNWSASAGSITPGGLFTAPKTAGTVTIRATSAEDPSASAAVSVKVTPAKVQAPAPTARDPFPRLTAGRNLLSPLKVKRIATRSYVAKVVAGRKGGQLRITVTNGRKVIKTKLVALKARKGFIYRVTLTRGVPLAKVRITARFTPKGSRTTIVRRAGIARL